MVETPLKMHDSWRLFKVEMSKASLLNFWLFSFSASKLFSAASAKLFWSSPPVEMSLHPSWCISPLKLCLHLQKIIVQNWPTKESVWSWREGAEEAFCGKRKKFKSCPSSVPSSWSSLPITIITVYDHCHDNHHSHHWWSSLSWRFKSLETVRSVPEYLILEATKFSGFNL